MKDGKDINRQSPGTAKPPEEDRHGQVLQVQTAPRSAGGARPRRGGGGAGGAEGGGGTVSGGQTAELQPEQTVPEG